MRLELELRQDYLKDNKVNTIYFGGGTPSVLEKNEILSILQKIYDTYNMVENPEITLECNPDDLSEDKLIALKEIGINRLSIGVQSFNDKDLKWMNRSHNADQSERCIKMAQQVGFDNITIDLIYGLPNQTLADWKQNLKKMFAYDIQHFSAYALTIEHKTILKHLVDTNKIKPLSEGKVLKQFNTLIDMATENRFVHYEISNFGKKGYFSNHNTAYWKHQHYLGIGPSAHSFNGNSRRWNVSSNKQYIQKMTKAEVYFEVEKLTINQQYNEYIFTSLRTIWGVNSKIIKERFGEQMQIPFFKEMKKWVEKAYVKQADEVFTLTKTGQIFADRIASDLFIVD